MPLSFDETFPSILEYLLSVNSFDEYCISSNNSRRRIVAAAIGGYEFR